MRIGIVATGSADWGPATVLAGLLAAIRANGAEEVVLFADHRDAVQRAVAQLTDDVDGLVLTQPSTSTNDLVLPAHLPTVTLTDVPNPHVLVIGPDQRVGALNATQHLLDLGHRCVHHIGGPSHSTYAPQRTRGWRDALVAAYVTPPGAAVAGDWTAAAGRALMAELLRQEPRPTAVFVANDQMAIGAMRAAADAGLRVPDDVSVVGFDDIPEAAHLSPALTTVRQDTAGATRTAVAELVAWLQGDPPPQRRVFLPVELVVRESSGPPDQGVGPSARN